MFANPRADGKFYASLCLCKDGCEKHRMVLLCVVFLCFFLNPRLSIVAGALSVGESISGDEYIISERDGKFKLGFFTPGNDSQNYYVGIWYRKITEITIV
ncbi:hypothetical protein NE237_001816 [Protea cynaroides]|uniref:Uncharacterized protein n=1 Tax=Protea cynaroides TaxID=273540 RepID=A0A9Q0QYV5_9MAGN|nr:hypothetical protein NE237_001816 [Protea cynaroides]